MENRIKEQQMVLFSDRTSTRRLKSNQLRLWFSSAADSKPTSRSVANSSESISICHSKLQLSPRYVLLAPDLPDGQHGLLHLCHVNIKDLKDSKKVLQTNPVPTVFQARVGARGESGSSGDFLRRESPLLSKLLNPMSDIPVDRPFALTLNSPSKQKVGIPGTAP